MAQNFIESRREQGFLLPPDVRDWLGADHLAWFVIDAVEQMDLSAFYAAYRADGHGRAAYEPSLMVAVILFAFATGVRSSRAIERHCREHVAFRVITGEPGSRSCDCGAVHLPPPAGAVGAVRRGVEVVPQGGVGQAGGGVDRWHPDRW